jgi:DNA-binding MarR family transcriptional regulator
MRTPMQRRYGTHLTQRNIRRVWAAVTANPRASKKELGRALRLSYGAVAGTLRFLNDAGYIHFEKSTKRAITVLVPFVITKKAKR